MKTCECGMGKATDARIVGPLGSGIAYAGTCSYCGRRVEWVDTVNVKGDDE